jgi:hypothetical protein
LTGATRLAYVPIPVSNDPVNPPFDGIGIGDSMATALLE